MVASLQRERRRPRFSAFLSLPRFDHAIDSLSLSASIYLFSLSLSLQPILDLFPTHAQLLLYVSLSLFIGDIVVLYRHMLKNGTSHGTELNDSSVVPTMDLSLRQQPTCYIKIFLFSVLLIFRTLLFIQTLLALQDAVVIETVFL